METPFALTERGQISDTYRHSEHFNSNSAVKGAHDDQAQGPQLYPNAVGESGNVLTPEGLLTDSKYPDEDTGSPTGSYSISVPTSTDGIK